MISRVLITVILSICSATSVSAKCSVCSMGEKMVSSEYLLPANTISFITVETKCTVVEFATNTLNETDANCTIIKNSAAPSLCGCTASETLPNVTSYNTTKSQVNLTLSSVFGKMEDNATIEMYEKVLTTFYKTYLAGMAVNVSAKVHKQALNVSKNTSRRLHDEPSLFSLNTTINITGAVDSSSKLAYSGNFSDLCTNITQNNSYALISALKDADLAGNTSFYSNLTEIGASKIVPSVKKVTRDTKKPELPKGVTAGIMIGIFAALCAAVYVASLGQGERLLQREIAREQREAAMKARAEKTKEAKKVEYDEDLDEA